MHRFRTCTEICGQTWELRWSNGVFSLVLSEGITDKAQLNKSSVNLEEPQAQNLRTKNRRISVRQVPNHRAEGGPVSL